jgi:hypothetical protein
MNESKSGVASTRAGDDAIARATTRKRPNARFPRVRLARTSREGGVKAVRGAR